MIEKPSFLGTGWGFPPAFSKGGADVHLVSGVEDIHQSLQILLSTAMGERVMLEDYGCDLMHAVFEEIDQGLINTITRLISDAILLYEPRIILDDIDVSQDRTEPDLLLVSITYTVRSTNSRFNMVYPFYLREASLP